MGYYTRYYLEEIVVSDKIGEEKQTKIEEINNSNMSDETKEKFIAMIEDEYNRNTPSKQQVISDLQFNPFDGDSCKWYEHDEDMMAISEKYPGTIFTLKGYGEEAGDAWKKYYYNGKMQYAPAKLDYDEFDESKLSEAPM